MGLLLPLSAFSQLSLLMLKPSPRLRLMPTMAITTAMDWPTTGTDMLIMATTATLMLTMATTTARDLLMLSPRLMLTMVTMDMDMDWLTMATTATLMLITTATTTARGLLTLSPLLMPTMATLMLTTATTATTTESNH